MTVKNKLMVAFFAFLLILFFLKYVGVISKCNGEYRLGSCSEVGKVYN